jgi:hypothetical protein
MFSFDGYVGSMVQKNQRRLLEIRFHPRNNGYVGDERTVFVPSDRDKDHAQDGRPFITPALAKPP